jgi:hypothetical protein
MTRIQNHNCSFWLSTKKAPWWLFLHEPKHVGATIGILIVLIFLWFYNCVHHCGKINSAWYCWCTVQTWRSLNFICFFFFFWHYSSWWNLSLFKIVLRYSRSRYLRLQFLVSVFFRSSSTDSSHLNLGFPTCQVPSGLSRVSPVQISSSCILKRCPSNLRCHIFITLTMSSSL